MSDVVYREFGRLQLEQRDTWSSIIEKPTLESSFHDTPRKVLHVGSHPYVAKFWNKYIKQQKYLENPKTLNDYIRGV